MTIHKEGTATIIIILVALVIINLVPYMLDAPPWVSYILIPVSVLFFLFIVSFFRRPHRRIVADSKKVYAPADGVVVSIEETHEEEFLKEKRKLVSIFMSPLNVHMNLFPVAGKIIYNKYHPGKYLVAWHPKSSTENERTTIVIEMEDGTRILVRQIAGAVARRIVNYAKEGLSVKQGDELGFIKFGSRVDIFLPLHAAVDAKIDQVTRAGISTIATFK
jgi:phosphatidylserine decarboxylase